MKQIIKNYKTAINNYEDFFSWTYEHGTREKVSKFYSIAKSSKKHYQNILLSVGLLNKDVLEYGCGTGSYAFFLAKNGAKAIAIDIDKQAIDQAVAIAKSEELSHLLRFLVMDAENMGFKDDKFDLICGVGILHHINLDKALSEILRVIKLEGKAIFIEPLGHNPVINLFRKFTPHLRDTKEHPLRFKDLKLIKQFFYKVDIRFFYFLSLLSVPFRNTKTFFPLLGFLERIDNWLFKYFPFARFLAWQVVIFLEKPVIKRCSKI